MMTFLLDMPLLLMLSILPLAWLAALLLQAPAVRKHFSPAPLLVVAGSAILTLSVAALLLYAALYLFSPALATDIEAATAAVAWLDQLLGPLTLADRAARFACLLLSLALIAMAVRQRFREGWLPCVVALGYFSSVTLVLGSASFWSIADAFLIVAAALGLYSCLMRPGRIAWLLCGIALGIAINSSFTGVIYFLPYLAWFLDRDGYRALLVTLLAAAVTALLPFLVVEPVSLVNYLAAPQFTETRDISLPSVLHSLAGTLFIVAPVLSFLLWQAGSVGIRSWFLRRAFVCSTAIIAALLIVIVCSLPGSGPRYLLPLLPALALVVTFAVSDVYAYRPTTSWSVYGFWAPLAAFLVAVAVKSCVSLYLGQDIVTAQISLPCVNDQACPIMALSDPHAIHAGQISS